MNNNNGRAWEDTPILLKEEKQSRLTSLRSWSKFSTSPLTSLSFLFTIELYIDKYFSVSSTYSSQQRATELELSLSIEVLITSSTCSSIQHFTSAGRRDFRNSTISESRLNVKYDNEIYDSVKLSSIKEIVGKIKSGMRMHTLSKMKDAMKRSVANISDVDESSASLPPRQRQQFFFVI
ncbi:hypothetical protein RO3G_08178 [Rhizopus delemar RA 99-880]|uniref:Uncharacterized protein n=1 Tax=Rhizopus delemar (strain RA 99-880 / ATCC MYA-4621 / FGSC 9543 / NRRL 43880) TaxID=246409 RepID=I1C4U3_RHIO9|nr:hypothetical protein RO3G_08178 [Rhizopus delemar RA 99-880]|eukprot:EIE83473.1 hypothetical protein RO3G_08178 [Rhizopus delemar RA 99-880]